MYDVLTVVCVSVFFKENVFYDLQYLINKIISSAEIPFRTHYDENVCVCKYIHSFIAFYIANKQN